MRRFTLIELVAVMVIGMILMALAVPVLSRSGRAVEAGARMMTAAARLARVEAISERRRVAVLLPESHVRESLAGQAFAYCYVTREGEFDGAVPRTRIEMLPAGCVVDAVLASDGAGPAPIGATVTGVEWSDWGAAGGVTPGGAAPVGDCRAVVWRPRGCTADQRDYIVRLASGAVQGGSLVLTHRSEPVEVCVAGFTGRVTCR